MKNEKDFPEWIITKALAEYLKRDDQRKEWFFGLKAATPDGTNSSLSELCGFQWQAGQIEGKAESVLALGDRGVIAEDEFKKNFWGRTADFRFWTEHRAK